MDTTYRVLRPHEVSQALTTDESTRTGGYGQIALMVFLLVGFCAYVVPTWAATGGSYVLPPQEVGGQIRVVDRPGGRLVMEERNLEFFAADPRQLDGLAEAQKVRLRFQQQDGRQLIYSIAPVL